MLSAVVILCAAALVAHGADVPAANNCTQCHPGKTVGFSAGHLFGAENCTICHAGDSSATTEHDSHAGMTGFPGLISNAQRSCGSCHAEKVSSVSNSLMHTGRGMVSVTREIVDGNSGASDPNLQSLGHGPADSMLRKLCSSCHLGQEKDSHQLDPVRDRGGGCLACHINSYPEVGHPALSANVSDARCFGCHSRSARISLSYTGLAEIDPATAAQRESRLRLADGRHVERKPADVHFVSGMNCIGCHQGSDLMAGAGDAVHQRDAVASRCEDCHEVELASDGQPHDAEHERLECAACHSQWAPQCFGCHMQYDAGGSQWDHIEQRETAGRWHEQRSAFRNELGALGVNRSDRIELFVPGMIMTLSHPDWNDEKFVRIFAPISPHTIGPARSCESCHRSSIALGLGQGTIEYRGGEIHFSPSEPLSEDGLPADAWTSLDGKTGGGAPLDGQRPLNKKEMETVLTAPLP